MSKSTSLYLPLVSVFFIGIGLYTLAPGTTNTVHGEQMPEEITVVAPTTLISQPIFRENDGASVSLSPRLPENTTNLIFYIKCPSVACPADGTTESPVYLFNNETLARGDLPFSEYWQPPALTDYIVIEYRNDLQQFSCSGITWEACRNDPHFVSLSKFSLVDKNTTITSDMITAKTIANDDTNSTGDVISTSDGATDELKKLSISLSASSITSSLDDGQIVTAILDGKSSIISEPEVLEETDKASIGGFLLDIVDNVIDLFTSDAAVPQVLPETPPGEPLPATEQEDSAAITAEPIVDNESTLYETVTPEF